MDDAVAVQVAQRKHQLPGNGLHHWLGQPLVVFQDLEQLALRELGDHTEIPLGLEGVQHENDVLMSQGAQDLQQ
jgi:hypothetical protein